MNSTTWTCKAFEELSLKELYAILRLRNEVFVVEQNCVYQDLDNKDSYALHCMGWQNNVLVAYTRLFNKGIYFSEAAIGRVVTSPLVRGTGVGRELMEQSIQMVYERMGRQPIRISAQLYLLKFYESIGFQQVSPVYLEDGIKHIEMLLSAR